MSALCTSQIPPCLREARTTTNLTHFQVNLKAEFDGRIFAYVSFKTDAIYAINICTHTFKGMVSFSAISLCVL